MDQAIGMFGLIFENLVYIFAFIVLFQLVFCYALQVIADKQGFEASWMAWVPLLQIYPMVLSGSSSFQPFVLLMAAGVATAIVGALIGPLGSLLAIACSVWAIVYFVQLCWNTAERRGVSGWIGLLAFVPLVNLAAYLYIALHDGSAAPNRLGLALGIVFFVLPAYPEMQKAEQIAEFGRQLGPMAAAAEQGDETAMQRMIYEMLETMQGMEGFEAQGGDAEAMSQAMAELAASMERGGERTASERPHPPVLEVPELSPISPFFDCPEGTRERGARPPKAFERWCERQDPTRGRLRHGGYVSWHRNGQINETGLYKDGKRHGVWTRWHEKGGQQTQAEFQDGLQHGFQLDWNESGHRLREIRFAKGKPVGSDVE
jgi:hypothetical protein